MFPFTPHTTLRLDLRFGRFLNWAMVQVSQNFWRSPDMINFEML
nr:MULTISPECIES: hypothetical protein [unclassified Arthrospira]